MNQREDFTPSLIAGLVRYRARVGLVVLGFAFLGMLFAWTSWKPQATMTVVVQVSTANTTTNNIDPDRTTNEVSAALSSPDVLAATETASGVTIDKIATSWSQGESTIGVVVTASSPEDAKAAAVALLPAYTEVRQAQTTAELQGKLAEINTALDGVNQAIIDLDARTGVSAAAIAQAQGERDTLVAQRAALEAERRQTQVAAATPAANVVIASGPDAGPGRVSLMIRYVPVAILAGLLACMAVIAVVERRRPWLADPETAVRLLRTPLLGVGSASDDLGSAAASETVVPVVAMSILRAIGDTPMGVALIIPCGGREAVDASEALAHDLTPLLERAGANVAVVAVAASGRAVHRSIDGQDEEIGGLWSVFSGREKFESKLQSSGIDSDLVVLVPRGDTDHEILLDLMLLADVTVVATGTGSLLEPLFALRRDYDALGRDPDGVVVDLAVR